MIEVRNPYNGDIVGTIKRSNSRDVTNAIERAQAALAQSWPQHERAEMLERAVLLLKEREAEFAELISLEAGKPITLAQAEVKRAADTLRYSAIVARTLTGEVVPVAGTSVGAETHLAYTMRRPIGVVAAITPFNFPLNLSVHKLAPALAVGCPIVHKPASSTPLVAQKLHELLIDAGTPEAFLHLVCGSGGELGDAIVENRLVKHISFTGSSAVGWQLQQKSPRARVGLELGNNTPLIALADAPLDDVANAVAQSGFGYAGQSCISVQRVLVAESAYSDLVERIRESASKVVSGDPADVKTVCGPLITTNDRDRVLKMIDNAKRAGASLISGGDYSGSVIEPTVLADIPSDSELAIDEAFGPVVAIQKFADEAEAIALANSTEYGLQAGVFTADLDTAMRFARSLEFGGVTINRTPTWRADQMPYGGIGESGNTKEGPAWAVRELTTERIVVVG